MAKPIVWIVLAIVVASAIGIVTLTSNTSNNQSGEITTSFSQTTVSVPISSTIAMNPSTGRPNGCDTLASSSSNEGVNLNVYVSATSAPVGNQVCIYAKLQQVSGASFSQNQTFSLSFSLRNSSGGTISLGACSPLGVGMPGLAPPKYYQCGTEWDSAAIFNGAAVQAGQYQLSVNGSVIGQQGTVVSLSSQTNINLTSG